MRRYILIPALLFVGCGLTVQDFDGKVKANIILKSETVDTMACSAYPDGKGWVGQVTVNTDDNADVRDNRDRIKEGSGKIREISVEIVDLLPENMATFGGGSAKLTKAGEALPEYNHAQFSGVPIVEDQAFKLDITPERRAEISNLVFTETMITADLAGCANDDIAIEARITFFVEFAAGL